MLAFPDNFLQPDGNIRVELDFSIQSAKFCWDDEKSEDEEENAGKEAGKK